MLNLFQNKTNTNDLVYEAVKSIKYDQRDIERAFARLFSTPDGKKVLAHLQVMSFHRVHAPGAAEDNLRYAEGQRALVASILRFVERGRA